MQAEFETCNSVPQQNQWVGIMVEVRFRDESCAVTDISLEM